MPQYFIVFSIGRTATTWLSDVLSLHDDVICSHGQDLDPYRKDETIEGRVERTRREADSAILQNPDLYFDLLEEHPFKAYGNVHGLDPEVVLAHPERFRRRYTVVQMTRHPIARLRSIVRAWMKEVEATEFLAANHRRLLTTVPAEVRSIGMTMPPGTQSDRDMLFVRAVLHLTYHDRRFLTGPVPVYRMEDLTESRSAFRDFFSAVTEDAVPCSDDYVDTVFTSKFAYVKEPWHPQNRLSSEQIAFALEALDKLGLTDAYRRLGYDLSPEVCRKEADAGLVDGA